MLSHNRGSNLKTRIIFSTFLLILFCETIFGQMIPDWVYHPPRSPTHLYGVGISSLYSDESISFKEARVNAIESLTKQYHIRITAKLAEVQDGSIVAGREYSYETMDSLHYLKVFQNAVQIDSFSNGRDVFVLMAVAHNLSPSENEMRLRNVRYIDKSESRSIHPEWVTVHPQKKGYIFGVGVSARYRKMGDSWARSAEEARVEIAMALGVKHGSLERDYVGTDSYTIKWLEQTVDVELWGARIIERWYNPREKLFYTLVETKE